MQKIGVTARNGFGLGVVAVLILSSCGGDNTTSGRTRNSAMCFETQDEKDAEVDRIQLLIDEVTPKSTQDASSTFRSAFIRPLNIFTQSHNLPRTVSTSTTTPSTTTPSTTTPSTTTPSTTTPSTTTPSTTTPSTTTPSVTVVDSSTTLVDSSTTIVELPTTLVAPSTTTLEISAEDLLAQYEFELTTINATPLCNESSTSELPECVVEAGFDEDQVFVDPCDEATHVIIYVNGEGFATVAKLGTRTMQPAGDEPWFDFEVSIDGIVVTADTVHRISSMEFSAESSSVQCDVVAGFDQVDSEVAYVDVCPDAQGVLFTVGSVETYVDKNSSSRSELNIGSAETFEFVVLVNKVATVLGTINRTDLQVQTFSEPPMDVDEIVCEVEAGFDENDKDIAFVLPCLESTHVFIYGDSDRSMSQDVVDNQRNTQFVGDVDTFRFEVFLGSRLVATAIVERGDPQKFSTGPDECEVVAGFIDQEMFVDPCDEATYIEFWWGESGDSTSEIEHDGARMPVEIKGLGYFMFVVSVGDVEVTSGIVRRGTPQTFTEMTTDLEADSWRVMELNGAAGEQNCSVDVQRLVINVSCDRPLSLTAWYDDQGLRSSSFLDLSQENVVNARIEIETQLGVSVFERQIFSAGEPINNGRYEFMVPAEFFHDEIREEWAEEEKDLEREPWFEGEMLSNAGQTTSVDFTVPDDYPVDWFYFDLNYSCADQNIDNARFVDSNGDELIPFEIHRYGPIGPEVCGFYLFYDTDVAELIGETSSIVFDTESNAPIEWAGNIQLEGVQVLGEPLTEEVEETIDWVTTKFQIDAPLYFELEIPAGGLYVEVQGNSNQSCDVNIEQEPFVDPFLLLFEPGSRDIIVENDSGRHSHNNCFSASIKEFLTEGVYVLEATTLDLLNRDEFRWAETEYELVIRLGTVVQPDQKSSEESAQNVPIEELAESVISEIPAPQSMTHSEPEAVLRPKDLILRESNETVSDQSTSTSLVTLTPRESAIVVPVGVDELECDSSCINDLFKLGGVDEGIIIFELGNERIEIDKSVRRVSLPITPNVHNLVVEIQPADGSAPVILSRELVVLSPRDMPKTIGERFNTRSQASSSPQLANPPVLVALLALMILIGVARIFVRKTSAPKK